MIGPFGWDVMEEVRARTKSLFGPEICVCPDCLNAGIAKPSVLNCETKRTRTNAVGKDVEVYMGRWLHGLELKQYYEARANADAAFKEIVQRRSIKPLEPPAARPRRKR